MLIYHAGVVLAAVCFMLAVLSISTAREKGFAVALFCAAYFAAVGIIMGAIAR